MSTLPDLDYPFCLPTYVAAFDDGQFAQRELKEKACSWRSEGYAEDSRVHIFDHHEGVGSIRICNDNDIDRLLVSNDHPHHHTNCTNPYARRSLRLRFALYYCCLQYTRRSPNTFARMNLWQNCSPRTSCTMLVSLTLQIRQSQYLGCLANSTYRETRY